MASCHGETNFKTPVDSIKTTELGRAAIGFGAARNFPDAIRLEVKGFDSGVRLGLVFRTSNRDHPLVRAAREVAGSEQWRTTLKEMGLGLPKIRCRGIRSTPGQPGDSLAAVVDPPLILGPGIIAGSGGDPVPSVKVGDRLLPYPAPDRNLFLEGDLVAPPAVPGNKLESLPPECLAVGGDGDDSAPGLHEHLPGGSTA